MNIVPVIIPTYKGEERLPRVRDCILNQRISGQIDTITWLRDNNTNGIYYTRAVNEGLLKFSPLHEFCLVLCDDVYLEPGCLRELLLCARALPRAGIISPVQKNRAGKVVWAGSASSWPYGAHMTEAQTTAPYCTYWPSGAVFLVRSQMLAEIGVMDGNMRFICSDADFGLTARARGWQCVVEPKAFAEHDFRGSKQTDDVEMNRLKTRDLLYFTRKWLSGELFRRLEYKGHELTDDRIKSQERIFIRTLEESFGITV